MVLAFPNRHALVRQVEQGNPTGLAHSSTARAGDS
jgi:hypothetical protein